METQKNKIGFKDLTTALKILVVSSWIVCGYVAIAFLIGFIIGLIENI